MCLLKRYSRLLYREADASLCIVFYLLIWYRDACAVLSILLLARGTFRNPSRGSGIIFVFGQMCTGVESRRPVAAPDVSLQVFPSGDRVVTRGKNGVGIVWRAASGRRLWSFGDRLPERRHSFAALTMDVQAPSAQPPPLSLSLSRGLRAWSPSKKGGACCPTLRGALDDRARLRRHICHLGQEFPPPPRQNRGAYAWPSFLLSLSGMVRVGRSRGEE